ncbi:hypothetical protein [Streptomyces sp. NPDC091209]|uniref:hypothetical protein n=1 Tax=Streptomyces sp. NPDC091209 TaxID=3365974 RepID=UPI00382E1AB9
MSSTRPPTPAGSSPATLQSRQRAGPEDQLTAEARQASTTDTATAAPGSAPLPHL